MQKCAVNSEGKIYIAAYILKEEGLECLEVGVLYWGTVTTEY